MTVDLSPIAQFPIVNRDPTGLDDWADHVLSGSAGEILAGLVERVEKSV